MAIGFVGVASKSTNAETSTPHDIVINRPSGVAQDDLMLACIQTQGNITGLDAIPTGWTSVLGGTAGVSTPTTSNAGNQMHLYRKKAAAAESTSYTFSQTGSGVYSAVIVAYSGVSTSTGVIASASTTSDTTTDTTVNCPALNNPTTSDDCGVVKFASVNPSCVACTVTFSTVANYIERFDSGLSDDGTTLRASLAVIDRLTGISTGTEGATDVTVSEDGRNVGFSVMLKDKVGAAGITGYIEPKNRMRRTLAVQKRAGIR